MRYLVNRETKEHRIDRCPEALPAEDWYRIEADSEGWIPHTGNECPLPDDVDCQWKSGEEHTSKTVRAGSVRWSVGRANRNITHYKPILEQAEKVQEPVTDAARKERAAELLHIESASKRMMLLDRLKAAHEAAQQIPDLEAELREVLGSMGYDLVARSPFFETEETAQNPQDMSDWRNWREGDLVRCLDSFGWGGRFLVGKIYKVERLKPDGLIIAGQEIGRNVGDFRFHSRPAKGE